MCILCTLVISHSTECAAPKMSITSTAHQPALIYHMHNAHIFWIKASGGKSTRPYDVFVLIIQKYKLKRKLPRWNYKYIYWLMSAGYLWMNSEFLVCESLKLYIMAPVSKDIPISWNKWDILYKWKICQYSLFHIFFSLSFVLSFGLIQPKVTTVDVGEYKVKV